MIPVADLRIVKQRMISNIQFLAMNRPGPEGSLNSEH
jgi:hypothetical protein